MTPIVITEEVWANSQLSIVRRTGIVRFAFHKYVIVDKFGRDIFELSEMAEKEGRQKAIEPGEPCDLCRMDFVPIYKELGRHEFFRFLKENPDLNEKKDALARLKTWNRHEGTE